jgi:ribosome-binding factor A
MLKKPNPHREERVEEILRELASKFILEEGTKTSLITVTKVKLSPDGAYATILFTVYPETKEHAALEFDKRNRSEFRDCLKEKSRLGRIPFIDFEIDLGEKNRQKIDALDTN